MDENTTYSTRQSNHIRLSRILGRVYLLYLGILPAIGTFAALVAYGTPGPFLLFLGGIAAVGVYLAVTYSYTRIPANPLLILVMLLDGPLVILIAQQDGYSLLGFLIESYLVDGTAIWLSILLLSLTSQLPTRGQRIGSVFFMLVALVATSSLFWPYMKAVLWNDWVRMMWLLAGTLVFSVIHYRRFYKENIVRTESDFSILYIAGLVMLWVFAMLSGNIIHASS